MVGCTSSKKVAEKKHITSTNCDLWPFFKGKVLGGILNTNLRVLVCLVIACYLTNYGWKWTMDTYLLSQIDFWPSFSFLKIPFSSLDQVLIWIRVIHQAWIWTCPNQSKKTRSFCETSSWRRSSFGLEDCPRLTPMRRMSQVSQPPTRDLWQQTRLLFVEAGDICPSEVPCPITKWMIV